MYHFDSAIASISQSITGAHFVTGVYFAGSGFFRNRPNKRLKILSPPQHTKRLFFKRASQAIAFLNQEQMHIG